MAKTATPQTVSNVFLIDPFDPLIVFDEAENTRTSKYTQREIKEKAADLIEIGQLQPIELRRLEDGSLKVVFGVGRLLAGRWIVENHDKKFKLLARIVEGVSDADAFKRSVAENWFRRATTPIDDAHNIARMIAPVEEDGLGMSQKDVAAFYSVSAASVSQKLKLLILPNKMQKAIADGKLPMRAALVLASIEDEGKRERMFEKEMEKIKSGEQKRVSTTQVTKQSRTVGRKSSEKKDKQDEQIVGDYDVEEDNSDNITEGDQTVVEAEVSEPEEEVPTTQRRQRRTPGVRMRSVQEIREFFEQATTKKAQHPTQVKQFAKDMIDYINGKLEDGDLQASMYSLLEYTPG